MMAKLACYSLVALALCLLAETSFAMILDADVEQTVDINPCNGSVTINSEHEVVLTEVEPYQHGFGYFMNAKIKSCDFPPRTWASSSIEALIGLQNILSSSLQTVRLCGTQVSVLSETIGGYGGEFGWSTPDQTISTPCDVITVQEPETAATPASRAQRQPPELFRIPKDQINKYVLVKSFYSRGEDAIHSEVPGFYRDLLQRLGIERGSAEELALVDSIAGASLVLNVKAVDNNSLRGREHMRFQLRVVEKKTKGLAMEFAKLIFELDRLGYPTDRLDVYLEERIRPSTGISISGEDWDYEALEIQSRFDDLLTKNLEKLRQRGGR